MRKKKSFNRLSVMEYRLRRMDEKLDIILSDISRLHRIVNAHVSDKDTVRSLEIDKLINIVKESATVQKLQAERDLKETQQRVTQSSKESDL